MNRILAALALVSSCLMAEIKWAASYNEAVSQAKKEQKNIMVMLSKEGCPACDYMENVVFEEKMVSDAIYKNFVPVHIDIHQDKIPGGLGFIGTPTFYFLDTEGKKLGRHDGGANIPTFMGILRNIKK